MNIKLIILAVFCSAQVFSQGNCAGLEKGVFELYENGIKIGLIYRENGIQLESYRNKPQQYTKAIYERKEACFYYLKSYEIKKEIDTITWQVSYKNLKDNVFSFVGSPAFLKSGYSFQGKLIKIRDTIGDKNILKILNNLSK